MSHAAKLVPFDLEVRHFPQARAQRTFERLIESATELFVSKGFDATQTPDIATTAGVSVGTFYRYFPDKRDIFLEILKRELSRSYEEVMSRLTPDAFVNQDRAATIEKTLEILLHNMYRHPELERVFLEMSMRDKEVAGLRHAFDKEARKRIAALIAVICTPEQVRDPEATAFIVHTAVVECAFHICGVRGPRPVSRKRSLAALTELIYRSLFGHVDS